MWVKIIVGYSISYKKSLKLCGLQKVWFTNSVGYSMSYKKCDYSFINLGIRWGWVANATSRPPYSWDDMIPIVQEVG
jgi:hypothetical protein